MRCSFIFITGVFLICLLNNMSDNKVLDTFKPEQLYGALAQAETGSFENPWIRTTAKDTPGGSSAFGPVQLTKTKAADYAKRGLLSPESKDFFELFLSPIYDDFLKYGNEPNKEGYDKEVDYGGTGYFPEEARPAYNKLVQEMIDYDYANAQKSDKPLEAFISAWRGVGPEKDPRYFESVKEFLQGAKDGK